MKKEYLEISIFLAMLGLFSPRLTAADPVVYENGGRRDPFVPLIGPGGVKTPKLSGDLQIEGIIYDPPAGSMALINGEFYKQGQRVGQAVVISILKDRIVLTMDDEEKTLWIREEIVTKGEHKNAEKKLPAKTR